jgi:hypothetical protein
MFRNLPPPHSPGVQRWAGGKFRFLVLSCWCFAAFLRPICSACWTSGSRRLCPEVFAFTIRISRVIWTHPYSSVTHSVTHSNASINMTVGVMSSPTFNVAGFFFRPHTASPTNKINRIIHLSSNTWMSNCVVRLQCYSSGVQAIRCVYRTVLE